MSQANQTENIPASLETTIVRSRAAYNRLLVEIEAVPEEGLASMNIDVAASVTTALGVLPELATLRDTMQKLSHFDVSALLKLEDYTLALHHTNLLCLAASAGPEEIAGLVEQSIEARELLLTNLQTLAKHGLVPASRIEEFERTAGHRGIAIDVGRLALVLREFWPVAGGKTPLTLEHLEQLEQVGERLLFAVGVREQGPANVSEAAMRRQRAFTLFVRAYEEVRRGMIYLRHYQGDADQIIPSLYAGRSGRRRSESSAPAAPVAPAQAAAVPAAPSASPPVGVGMPGSSPFLKS